MLHPSGQAGQYRRYVEDVHSAFYERSSPVRLSSCALHDHYLEKGDALFADRYGDILERSPAFPADQFDTSVEHLGKRLERGEGLDVPERVEHVEIGDFPRPWKAKPSGRRLARGIPKAPLRAHEPARIERVDRVHAAQRSEFDYVGVIFGPDLTYGFARQCWQGHRDASHDTVAKHAKDDLTGLVENSYRVLLSRDLKG